MTWQILPEERKLIPKHVLDLDEITYDFMKKNEPDLDKQIVGVDESLLPERFLIDITDIKDQGRCGSCTGFAATACLETLAYLNKGFKYDLSEQFCYSINKLKDPWAGVNYPGSSTSTAANTLLTGVCHESLCPYLELEFVEPTQPMLDDAKFRRAKFIHFLDKDQVSIKQALFKKMPILIAIKMFPEFKKPNGTILTKVSRIMSSGHALMIFGYDKESVYIKNSWGEAWGNHGTIQMAWDVLFKVLKTCIAIEGIAEPWNMVVPSMPNKKKVRLTVWGKIVNWFRKVF